MAVGSLVTRIPLSEALGTEPGHNLHPGLRARKEKMGKDTAGKTTAVAGGWVPPLR